MFGNYSMDSVKEISEKRTEKALALIEKNGGKFTAGYGQLYPETNLRFVLHRGNDFPSLPLIIPVQHP